MAGEITNAVVRWSEGDDSAQHELYALLHPFLIGLVRKKRPKHVKRRVESEAIENQVLKSFLTGIRRDQFPELGSRVHVRRILAKMIKYKLLAATKFHERMKRDVSREDHRPLEVSQRDSVDLIAEDLDSWMEKIEDSLHDLGETAITIFRCKIDDMSNRDIAESLGQPVALVRKQVKRIQFVLREHLGEDGL